MVVHELEGRQYTSWVKTRQRSIPSTLFFITIACCCLLFTYKVAHKFLRASQEATREPANESLLSYLGISTTTLDILLQLGDSQPEDLGRPPSRTFKSIKCKDNDRIKQRLRIAPSTALAQNVSISPRGLCNCSLPLNVRIQKIWRSNYVESMCSAEATLLGEKQKVISFSLFFKANTTWQHNKKMYFHGIQRNLEALMRLYPGWVMRVFTNIDYTPEICQMVCSSDILYFCDVRNLPQLGNMEWSSPFLWRALVVGDPTVSKFLVRDLDGILHQREKDAVSEWEASRFPLHVMRDHPMHGSYIIGGMWGGDNDRLCWETAHKIRDTLMAAQDHPDWAGVSDHLLLTQFVYFAYSHLILSHDSYLCVLYRGAVPFPSQRPNDYYYVGITDLGEYNTGKYDSLQYMCREECRPPHGKHWDYC